MIADAETHSGLASPFIERCRLTSWGGTSPRANQLPLSSVKANIKGSARAVARAASERRWLKLDCEICAVTISPSTREVSPVQTGVSSHEGHSAITAPGDWKPIIFRIKGIALKANWPWGPTCWHLATLQAASTAKGPLGGKGTGDTLNV
jgi:hypothetical protein